MPVRNKKETRCSEQIKTAVTFGKSTQQKSLWRGYDVSIFHQIYIVTAEIVSGVMCLKPHFVSAFPLSTVRSLLTGRRCGSVAGHICLPSPNLLLAVTALDYRPPRWPGPSVVPPKSTMTHSISVLVLRLHHGTPPPAPVKW